MLNDSNGIQINLIRHVFIVIFLVEKMQNKLL